MIDCPSTAYDSKSKTYNAKRRFKLKQHEWLPQSRPQGNCSQEAEDAKTQRD
jgi:hypothetical protein